MLSRYTVQYILRAPYKALLIYLQNKAGMPTSLNRSTSYLKSLNQVQNIILSSSPYTIYSLQKATQISTFINYLASNRVYNISLIRRSRYLSYSIIILSYLQSTQRCYLLPYLGTRSTSALAKDKLTLIQPLSISSISYFLNSTSYLQDILYSRPYKEQQYSFI